jgi:hypothetical protein
MEYMIEGVFSHVAPPRKVALWCEKIYNVNTAGKAGAQILHTPWEMIHLPGGNNAAGR